jgi:hypothetical protein
VADVQNLKIVSTDAVKDLARKLADKFDTNVPVVRSISELRLLRQ